MVNQKKIIGILMVIFGLLMMGELVVAKDTKCMPGPKDLPVNVDLVKLRQNWLGWNNDMRKKAGLRDYVEEPVLELSATMWSDRAVAKGNISHKRDGQTAYYDYKIIGAWFKSWGLEFKNINKATFTENIGWGYYKCPADAKADCTEAMTKAIRTTFDFFAGEKNRKYRPHYNSLMKKEFERIGMGISLDTIKHKYYMTVHYGTEIVSESLPLCRA